MMQEVNLKALLMNYNANLCDRQFAFILPKEKRLRIVFFRESLCHLMGLQHVFNWDKHYLGQKGYEKIKSEAITVDTLKKHNKKGYSFIKERLKHFDEIKNVLKEGQLFQYRQENVRGSTYITADFVMALDGKEMILHLFLRKENNTEFYTPVSFIPQAESDVNANKFTQGQKPIKIISREEILFS